MYKIFVKTVPCKALFELYIWYHYDMNKEDLYNYTEEMVKRAGITDPDYTDSFMTSLNEHPQIREEYIYYLEHGSYNCAYTIEGFSVADIVIWQMDHFKALVDDKVSQIKDNPYRMTLEGFLTMMKMEDDPDRYVSKIRSTTGTDYLGKY